MTTGRGIAPLADIPDGECRDGGPELVIRGEHPWLISRRQAAPVLPRWRHDVREPVEKIEWREFDDAIGPRSRGLPPAPRADPVCRLVPWQHVADPTDAAIFTTPDGEPLQREGRTGTVSQQVLEALEIAWTSSDPCRRTSSASGSTSAGCCPAVGRHRARSCPSQGPRQPAGASPQSALHCVASSSENPFQPRKGHEDSLTRPGSRFGEGVSKAWRVRMVPGKHDGEKRAICTPGCHKESQCVGALRHARQRPRVVLGLVSSGTSRGVSSAGALRW